MLNILFNRNYHNRKTQNRNGGILTLWEVFLVTNCWYKSCCQWIASTFWLTSVGNGHWKKRWSLLTSKRIVKYSNNDWMMWSIILMSLWRWMTDTFAPNLCNNSWGGSQSYLPIVKTMIIVNNDNLIASQQLNSEPNLCSGLRWVRLKINE